ncbi:GCN5-like N-acetyltransferase [Leptolyngbya boryana NIES-2135]|jgi:ribosomal protein S18 acetylase RimI-like enzyme|uniref:GCN5-like N-acetyltransferase n=1 Tax=Leptolyngbya boryana NIES-2135 TaxID=1973484 RepID=A0A1Z4JL70_LEPBY|nr:GNAT family N-acetyltransferase [Leptolyngbya sp. FACHB-161]MBD2375185.1 GNAT family N-acetyltransferase [Leptolyngbya sp. FACHB-238]MBD2399604.1 GNAT family N-acetyltransferase [Leptolyngbya sp. FACHB-239]MBD2405809.1 GNAT family N-acetyltransferase [Leptolyngbya sp. FACHB-402]BAS56316.1 sortase-like acyltransferase [Leptolyngbya boryana IAM M-101]BAS62664.1 sortase-like acyltransferase [Leptolyngbya boryana dg5]BAY57509.1 GCN5-like N-acetyltransferase [Leptolyngbya boryana NIES-2135]
MKIRNVQPSDYQSIICVVNEWWGGRQMRDMLPKLFFVHFCETSFIAEIDQKIIGFLIGFLSQSHSEEAYIHFVGIHPDFRTQGVGSALYQQFFQVVQRFERVRVRCVTSPVNQDSIAYHLRLGFEAEPSNAERNGVPFHPDYDGSGEDRVLFIKQLSEINRLVI